MLGLALKDRGLIKIDDCDDVFLAECVLENFRSFVSRSVNMPEDKFVAVHAFTLGDDGLSINLRFEIMMVIREDDCFVLSAIKEPECCLRHGQVIALYTKESFMYRSRFSNASPAEAAGGVVHGKLSDFAETAIPPSPGRLRKAVVSKDKASPQQKDLLSKRDKVEKDGATRCPG